jgi:hypothetical protein
VIVCFQPRTSCGAKNGRTAEGGGSLGTVPSGNRAHTKTRVKGGGGVTFRVKFR